MDETEITTGVEINPAMSPGAVEYSDNRASDTATDDRTQTLNVENTGDHIVQVGSHYHFFEANPVLAFERVRAYGTHLAIPSGDRVYFPPGKTVSVEVTPFCGDERIRSFYNVVDGDLDDLTPEEALERFEERAAEPIADAEGPQ